MGTLISNQEAIQRIRFVNLSAAPRKADKVVMVEGIVLVKLDDGTFATNRDLGDYAYVPGAWPWLPPVMRALRKLGAISKADMDAHLALCAAKSADRDKAWDREQVLKIAKRRGLELTAEQLAILGANELEAA